mmetsp:Transcript_10292/g.28395  ORF Transcript_10292/g.28395 Transcript_10292/m.28395 type:complete len:147 (-) Transcript_10292:94-534(-)
MNSATTTPSTLQAAVGTDSRRSGFGTVTPYLMVESVERMQQFLQAALGATETYRARGSGGGWHVEMQIGDTRIMMGQGGATVPTMLFLYVQDTDAVYQAALRAGATTMMEPGPNFQEQRGAAVVDPLGNTWFLATHDPTTTETPSH